MSLVRNIRQQALAKAIMNVCNKACNRQSRFLNLHQNAKLFRECVICSTG